MMRLVIGQGTSTLRRRRTSRNPLASRRGFLFFRSAPPLNPGGPDFGKRCHSNLHFSDCELVMAVDGELSPRCNAQVFAHLEACWSCRQRKAAMDEAIFVFVRAHNQIAQSGIGDAAGWRARLRARLAEEALNCGRRGVWATFGQAAAIAATLFAGCALE